MEDVSSMYRPARSSAPRPQRRRQDDDDQHDPRRARADRRPHRHPGPGPSRRPQRGARGRKFCGRYAPLPGNLTVEQNLRVFGMIYAVENLTRRIEQLLVAYDVSQFRRTKAGVLSSGEQTRLASPRRC